MSDAAPDEARDFWNRVADGWRIQVGDEGDRNRRLNSDPVLWDPRHRELAIIYTSEVDGVTKRVSENLTLDGAGIVVAGEVFHGVTGARPLPPSDPRGSPQQAP